MVEARPKNWGYAPKDGYVFNPLKAWPRNEACWCGSGLKAKKCCLMTTPATMTAKAALGIRRLMDMGVLGRGLVRQAFVNRTNELADMDAAFERGQVADAPEA